MKRSDRRVLTTFVGSLIRPPELRQLQGSHAIHKDCVGFLQGRLAATAYAQ